MCFHSSYLSKRVISKPEIAGRVRLSSRPCTSNDSVTALIAPTPTIRSGSVSLPLAVQLRVSDERRPASAIETPSTTSHPHINQLTKLPAAKAAMNPARLFFSPKGGEGSLAVYLPNTLPTVDALVSANARMEMDAIATSRLNDATDMMAPRRYQIVELSFWRSLSRMSVPTTDSYAFAKRPLPTVVERSLKRSMTSMTSRVTVRRRRMYVLDIWLM